MKKFTKRFVVLTLAGIVFSGLFAASSANAAIRNSAAKARGQFGTGFWNSSPRAGWSSRSYGGSSWRPSYQPRFEQNSYYYQPWSYGGYQTYPLYR